MGGPAQARHGGCLLADVKRSARRAMPDVCEFACTGCGLRIESDVLAWRCPQCNSALTCLPAQIGGIGEIDEKQQSLWRYRVWLACCGEPSVSLGEGWTPLVSQEFDGRLVHWKCDFLNPSGSFKDRGVAAMTNYLLARGVNSVTEDSSGNGGASLATYAAAARMLCRIYVPAETSLSKIAQIAATGSAVEHVSGSRAAVTEAAMQDPTSAYYASHNWHPMFAEGMKSIGFEIWEQLSFQAPEMIVMPVGGGSNVIGCYRAFRELHTSGLIGHMPKIIGVQSQACDPLARAMAAGSTEPLAVTPATTVAEGISLSNPVRGRETLAAVRATEGAIISVPESEIRAAHSDLARHGFYVEPTSATAAAGLKALASMAQHTSAQTIVVILTGSGLKTGAIA